MAKPSSLRRIVWLGIAATVALGALFALGTKAQTGPAYPHAIMTIQRANGPPVDFNIEIATTPEQHTHGLMFRLSVPQNTGMLFAWNPEESVSMWMKNTYVPLDFLFVRRDGIIVKIVTHGVPFSLTQINADEPVRGVVEIAGGEVDRLGLRSGDKVVLPAIFGPSSDHEK